MQTSYNKNNRYVQEATCSPVSQATGLRNAKTGDRGRLMAGVWRSGREASWGVSSNRAGSCGQPLEFRSNNVAHRPIIGALGLLARYAQRPGGVRH
jgi:hypothetical protein